METRVLTMVWALLLFLGVVAAVHWWEYRTSVQEYTFAQPATLDQRDELRGVLAEKTPVAVEIGALPWRPEVATKAPWTAQIDGTLEMSVGAWLAEETRSPLTNQSALAEQIDLATGLGDLDAARAWWWLPGLRDSVVDILPAGGVIGLSWVGAERQWIGCSHGGPITVWLVHSRYHRYLPAPRSSAAAEAEPIDPWSLTVAEAPWIGRVQYIEVTVKPGWCLGLPAHWGFALRAPPEEEAWWWTVSQHSALSWTLSNMKNKAPEHTESLSSELEE